MTDFTTLAGSLRALSTVPHTPDLRPRITLRHACLDSPIGPTYVALGEGGVVAVRRAADIGEERGFLAHVHRTMGRPSLPSRAMPAEVAAALRHVDGTSARVDLAGLAPFERDVLEAATSIPRGETRSYGWIAREIGRPRAVRAVGTALGKNPVPILVPCHRVVRSDGSDGEYIFGQAAKRTLLDLEARTSRAT